MLYFGSFYVIITSHLPKTKQGNHFLLYIYFTHGYMYMSALSYLYYIYVIRLKWLFRIWNSWFKPMLCQLVIE